MDLPPTYPNQHGNNDWTTENINLLRSLADQGISAAQIAAHFPGRSRNAILGKAFRIGVRLSHQAATRTYDSFWKKGDNLRELAGYITSPQGYSKNEIADHFKVAASTIRRGIAKLSEQAIKPLKPNAASIARRAAKKRDRKPSLEQLIAANAPRQVPELVPEQVPYCAVEIINLTSHTCRWPVEGEGHAMLYCGRQPAEGFPYCPPHCRMAYQVFRR